MGKAIESSPADLATVNAFLERHEIAPVPQAGAVASEMELVTAKRKAWELTHNFVGNLFMGPSAINSAIGFIRTPIAKIIETLESLDEETVEAEKAIEVVTTPQGPLNPEGRREWETFAEIMYSDIKSWADESGGMLPKQDLIHLLSDYQINADLDLPNKISGLPEKTMEQNLSEHYAAVTSVYLDLLEASSSHIFAVGGALDRFMAIDVGWARLEKLGVLDPRR